MMHFLLRAFFSQEYGQQNTYQRAAEMAFPGDVLRDSQRGYHTPDETAVKEHHDERDDDKHAVATDEAAHDEEEVESIDEGARPDVCRVGIADAPGD